MSGFNRSLRAVAWAVLACAAAAAAYRFGGWLVKDSPEPEPAPELAGEALLRAVQEARGLKALRPVEAVELDAKEFREAALGILRQVDVEGETRRLRALQLVGLIPAGEIDARAFIDDRIAEIAGFYATGADRVIVRRRGDGSPSPSVLAHELCHALDDQHFGLAGVRAPDQDRAYAKECLLEGSATILMMRRDFVRRKRSGGDDAMRDLASPPDARTADVSTFPKLWGVALEPYFGGAAFLGFNSREATAWITREYPRAAAARAFASPPRSSEQVLHPEKYWTPAFLDEPVAVAAPDLSAVLGDGWSMLESDVFGEIHVAAMTAPEELAPPYRLERLMAGSSTPTLAQFADALRVVTTVASEGWGGDRYALWENATAGASLVVWGSVWDTERDAEEMERALPQVEGVEVRASRSGDRLAVTFARGDVDDGRVEAARAAALGSVPHRGARPKALRQSPQRPASGPAR